MATHTNKQQHFSSRTFTFLKELQANNNKAWFDEHRARYESDVREPALAYIEAMAVSLRRISPHFTAIAKRSGGSLMRVHRDMRFARDGKPYKTNIGIQFRHERGRDVHAPGFYVHVEPGQCFLGAGIWRPESGTLAAIRREIADRPAAWRRAVTARRFTEKFELSGEQLSRPPRGYSSDSPCIDDLRRKDFIALTPVPESFVRRRDLPKASSELFRRATALMRFLCGALDLDY
ncbi:MAG TPA: DUF2461 domain-containing protein [Gammaproteobacteria bacterium]|nr:DUF2461 domain-containing protein [Gammaproteobacteria bacterium]